jgi:hypothetical protein
MVWYPTVDDLIEINILVLDLTRDKHPHKLRGSRKGLQNLIETMAGEESRGLKFQAAYLMQRRPQIQFFDGANHRTGYVAAKMFLRKNGKRLWVDSWENAYPFIRSIETKTLDDVQRWIERGTTEEP